MNELLDQLKKLKARRVFIQYPEGLKTKIQEISSELEKNGYQTVLCCEPTFGACDVRDFEAKRLKCDTVVHIAHTDFGVKSELPVIYLDYVFDIDPIPIIEKEYEKLSNYKNICVFTSLQYVESMKRVVDYLKKRSKQVFVGKTQKYEGQVLGCRVDAALKFASKVDCFLYVGTGRFHPMGVCLATEKPVYSLDLEKQKIIDFQKEKMIYLKKKAWRDQELKDANVVGIAVSWKRGQNRIDEAFALKEKLEKQGKKVYILAFDTASKSKTIGMKFDILINMLCPRMDDEDLL
ncbi:MAG: diphthamide biosynthesis enzyme Dph2 [Candidatus Aenigmarchaeota archaeon]|nr:diphthamide biosynthesis enzyme Dph2 [Candidatus Aenigmarchaeota archaeon]